MAKAGSYYNAPGGMSLYSPRDFTAHGIELRFVKTCPVEYRQFTAEFIPNLSIIDVLMFNSPEDINLLMTSYELI